MATIIRPLFAALTVLLAGAIVAQAEEPADAPVSAPTLRALRADCRWLARVLENLQETAVQDRTGQAERSVYRKADAALSGVSDFQAALKDKVSRKGLWEAYDGLDRRLSELRKAAEALGADARALQREAARVEAATGDLENTLLGTDVSPQRRLRVVKRQARRLLASARELERTAQYALSNRKAESAGDFRRFVEAVAALQKGVDVAAGPEQLRKEYDKMSAAWQKVAGDLKGLKTSENLYLIRVAGRTDRMLARMHALLGLPGKAPGLILQT